MKRTLMAILLVLLVASHLCAAISRNGITAQTGNGTSSTFSATSTGDLKVVWAGNQSTTVPTLPSGWTKIDSGTNGSASSWILGCNVSSSSSDTGTGTWTNATSVVGASWSGTSVGTTANCNTTGIGGVSKDSGSSATVTFLTITMTNSDNTSWVGAFALDVGGGNVAPTGMTQYRNSGFGLNQGFDTNGTVSSWSTQNVSTGNDVWETYVFEILQHSASAAASMPPVVY